MCEIEKNIAMPLFKSCKYPFDDMQIGDSFFVETSEIHNVRTAAIRHQNKSSAKFSTRMVENGYRVWRIK